MKEASAINTKPCKPIGLRSEAHQHLCPKALQFLSFTLEQEEYGIDIQKVQKLRGYDMDRLISSDEMGLIEKLAA